MAVQPINRTIEFFDESSHSIIAETDAVFKKRIKDAQKGAQRLKVVFAAPLEPIAFGSFVANSYPKSDVDNALIEAALEDNFVFAHLSPAKRASLIGAFEPIPFKRGAQIIKQGDMGDYFYVIGAGEVVFKVDGNDVGTAGAGKTFGELALLYQAPRAASCIAKTECGLFRLDQEHFRRILAQQAEDQTHDAVKVLKKVPYFKELDDAYLNKIACNLTITSFKDGEVVARKGEDVKRFFIIKQGQVKLTDTETGGSDYKDLTFGAGQFFGDAAIVDNIPARGTLTAVGDVMTLSLNRETFQRVVGDDIKHLYERSSDKRKLVSGVFICGR